jgi:hypothetical protein
LYQTARCITETGKPALTHVEVCMLWWCWSRILS